MRAVMTYARALNDAQAEGRWLNAATTPAALRARWITRSSSCASDASPDSRSSWSRSRRQYGRGALRRVEQAVRIHLHMEQPVFPDPRQKPTFLYFPGLPATPYLDKGLIPVDRRARGAAPTRFAPSCWRCCRAPRAASACSIPASSSRRICAASTRRRAGTATTSFVTASDATTTAQLPGHGGGARCAAAGARARPWPRSAVFGVLARHASAAALRRDEHARRGSSAAHDPRGLRAARGRRGPSLARRRGRRVRRHVRSRGLESQRAARAS